MDARMEGILETTHVMSHSHQCILDDLCQDDIIRTSTIYYLPYYPPFSDFHAHNRKLLFPLMQFMHTTNSPSIVLSNTRYTVHPIRTQCMPEHNPLSCPQHLTSPPPTNRPPPDIHPDLRPPLHRQPTVPRLLVPRAVLAQVLPEDGVPRDRLEGHAVFGAAGSSPGFFALGLGLAFPS